VRRRPVPTPRSNSLLPPPSRSGGKRAGRPTGRRLQRTSERGSAIALDEGTYEIVADLRRAVAAEVEEEEVGRVVKVEGNAICDRAYRREDCLDAVDALGYHVRLVLGNDEGTYNEVRERVRRHVDAADPPPGLRGLKYGRAGTRRKKHRMPLLRPERDCASPSCPARRRPQEPC
jgi:hypothetical protein